MTTRNPSQAGFKIDGRFVRKFLFMKERIIYLPHEEKIKTNFPVEVDAFDKDHAVKRLCEHYTGTERRDWEFIQELEPDQTVGMLGDSLPLIPAVVRADFGKPS